MYKYSYSFAVFVYRKSKLPSEFYLWGFFAFTRIFYMGEVLAHCKTSILGGPECSDCAYSYSLVSILRRRKSTFHQTLFRKCGVRFTAYMFCCCMKLISNSNFQLSS